MLCGSTLKLWKVGEKLAQGSCASVYAVEALAPLSKYDQHKRYVIKVVELPKKTEKGYKAKIRIADTLYSEYLIYKKCYNVDGVPDIPRNAYGEDKGFRFLVLQRFDIDLETMAAESDEPLPMSFIGRAGVDLIRILKDLHSLNVLYCDLKPANIMLNKQTNKIYCVDFGITETYLDVRGKHKEQASTKKISGTSRFLSANSHQGMTRSRKDDVLSLLYVLLYMSSRSLPWDHAKNDAECINIKSNISIEVLCKGLSQEWKEAFETIQSCDFKECPDYATLETLFQKIEGSE